MKIFSIGCDIGGSHISSAAVNMNTGQIIEGTRAQEPIDSQGAASDITAHWLRSIRQTLDKTGDGEFVGIGFAMPGPFDYANGIAMFERVPKYQSLYGMNIGDIIRKGLALEENLPVRFMNDATAFAVAEAWIGKTMDFRRSLAITLGTGFGSAFIDGSVPVLEGSGVPKLGCLWHLPFKDGMADDYFSTRWFVRVYSEKTGKQVHGAKELADMAMGGDSVALAIFDEFGHNLAECLEPWIRNFDGEAIVAGGNISEAGTLWEPAMQKRLKDRQVSVPMLFSELKEDAAIIGSARLMESGFWQKVQPLLPLM